MSPIRSAGRSLQALPRRRGQLACVLACCLVVAACSRGDPYTLEQHIERANKAIADKRPNEASLELKTALQQSPKSVQARLLFADVLISLNQGQAAIAELKRAEEYGANPATLAIRRGRAYTLEGDFERVLREVPASKVGAPDEVADRFEIRANAQMAMGKTADALTSFNTVLGIRPRSIVATLGKARIAAAKGDLQAAAQSIDSALAIDPHDVSALIAKGDLSVAQDKMDAAIDFYQQAVAADADSVSAHLALASVLIASNKLEPAREQIAIVKKGYPLLPSVNYLDAMMRFAEGKNKEAFDSVQKVLSALPENPPALALAGAIQYKTENYLQAEANVTKVLKMYPRNAFARKLLAAIYLKEKQPAKAIETLQPLLSNPQSNDQQLFKLAGSAYMQANMIAKAVEYLQRAEAISPSDIALKTAVGMGNLAAGDVDRAINSFESIAKLDVDNSDAESYLVLSYIGKKEYKKAIDLAQKMVAKKPNSPDFYNLLGGAYQASKDFPSARAAFEKAIQINPGFSAAVINLARLDVADKKPDEARKKLLAAYEHNKNNVDIIYGLANLEFFEGNREEGGKWLDAAGKADPESIAPRILQIRYFLERRDYPRAVALARETQAKFPSDIDMLALLAECEALSGDRSAAVASYGKLAALSPNSPRVQLEIARLEIAEGHLTSGAAALSKALAIDPRFVDAQVLLADLYNQTQKFDEAVAIGNNLVKQNPKSAVGLAVIGDSWSAQKKYDRAIKAYDDAFALQPSGIIVVKKYAALADAGRKPEATRMIEAWIQGNKKDVVSRQYYAAVQLRDGDVPAAERTYLDVVQIEPTNAGAFNELALIAEARKDTRALEYARKAYEAEPGNPVIGDTYGWIRVQHGQVAEGQRLLEQIVSATPSYSEARYHLAVAQAKSGDKAAAKANLQQALASRVPFPQVADAQNLLKTL